MFSTLLQSILACTGTSQATSPLPVSHEGWNTLLQKHVMPDGSVHYQGFIEDQVALQEYLDLLATHHPDEESWSREEQLAYWVNAYNAFTLKLVVDHYPVESIKDIRRGIPFVNSVWDIKFIDIGGHRYDLNNIEHSILRKKFDEPRIHFAINCASISCPDLRNEAYRAQDLDSQLAEQARRFINDPAKNVISEDSVSVSRIFQWFKRDFTRQGSLTEFLNMYSDMSIPAGTRVTFTRYDWRLNDKG